MVNADMEGSITLLWELIINIHIFYVVCPAIVVTSLCMFDRIFVLAQSIVFDIIANTDAETFS
jgi:hypothetical protein